MTQDNPMGARPPLTENVIKAVKEIEYYMRQIGADVAKVSQIGTLSIWVSGEEYVYTPIYQDMELCQIQGGWPPLFAQEGDNNEST